MIQTKIFFRWWIPTAIKVLALMNAANNLSSPSVIDYTEFYNVSLDHMDLMQEYYNWQNPGTFRHLTLKVSVIKWIRTHTHTRMVIYNSKEGFEPEITSKSSNHQAVHVHWFHH